MYTSDSDYLLWENCRLLYPVALDNIQSVANICTDWTLSPITKTKQKTQTPKKETTLSLVCKILSWVLLSTVWTLFILGSLQPKWCNIAAGVITIIKCELVKTNVKTGSTIYTRQSCTMIYVATRLPHSLVVVFHHKSQAREITMGDGFD